MSTPPDDAERPSPEALAAAVDTCVRALRLELREALSALERGVESVERLNGIADRWRIHIPIHQDTAAELRALAISVADHANTIEDHV